ncbi:MAG TPA: MDR family MFS transporter [Trebonia sp.]|nr:MDR family MFS transporter [Trebonia sp.]
MISQKAAVSVVYAGAMFIAVMDQTIVNVALAAIGRQFHTQPTAVAGAVIGYQVSVALFIPAAAWLGDRLGPRRLLLGSIAIFTVASALCGLAGSLDELVAFRVLQGMGGGLMTPVGLTMLFRAFPQEERVRASAILVIPTAFAPAVGPVIGGLFVTDVSWRWVFYVNVPIGLFALVFGAVFLADQDHPAAGRFDIAGFLTASLGLGLLMFGVAEGPRAGWTAGPIVGCIAAGAALLAAMALIELRSAAPLLDLRVYANRLFRSASIVLTLTSVAFFGLLYLLSLFFQDGLRFSALEAGSVICPEAFGVMLASQVISRRIYPAVGPRRVMAAGLLLIAAVAVLLTQAGTGTSAWLLRGILFVMGFGVAAVFLPSQAAGFATIGAERTSVASTIFNAQRMIGGAIGVALLTALLTALHPVRVVAGRPEANLPAFHDGLLVCAGVAVAAALAALTIRDADAAATMIRHRPGPRKTAAADARLSGEALSEGGAGLSGSS